MKLKSLIFILALISACKNDNCDPPDVVVYGISQTLYPFLFDQGSYWIYDNSANGLTDSIELISVVKDTESTDGGTLCQGGSDYSEWFNLSYFNFNDSTHYNEQLVGSVISRYFIHGGFIYLSGRNVGAMRGNTTIDSLIDTMQVGNNVFYNVVKMRIGKDLPSITEEYNYYYADSIGVVRKETRQNDSIIKTWNLLRYHTEFYPHL